MTQEASFTGLSFFMDNGIWYNTMVGKTQARLRRALRNGSRVSGSSFVQVKRSPIPIRLKAYAPA
jgi:hypothetical protein